MLRERRRERESENRMYLCISGAGSVPDMAKVVLVGRCLYHSNRGVYSSYGISVVVSTCRFKRLVFFSYMSLFVLLCVVLGG